MPKVELVKMKEGQKGIVIEIAGGHGLLMRLDAMGIRPGVKLEKVSSQFMRGPVIVKAGNTRVAIGFGMARKVIVEV